MKRLKATVTLFVFCALFLPPVMATGALAAKQQASKSRTAKATKPAKKIVKPVVVPLPDRNPNRQAASTSAPAPASPDIVAQAAPDMTGAVAEQPLPHEVPAAITTKAPPKGTGIPLPDRKPQSETKAAASPLVHMPDPSLLAPVPLATPVPPKPVSNSAYATILKPLLDYQLTASDAANLKTAFGASYRGDDAGAHAAVARIQDSAARKLATWFEYRNGDYDASAEAIEAFRLANPQWPGQEELRERAEIALFLADASPDRVRAFFGNGSPLTGAGKAALAGAFIKENNEPAARDLIISAWRHHQLNIAVEKKILARYGSMLTNADHQARIDKLLFPDSKASSRSRAPHLQALARRRAEEGRGPHRRGEARRECRQAARCDPRERDQWRRRLALQPHSMAPPQGS